MWEIIDQQGVIYSGREDEINLIWFNTIHTPNTYPRITAWVGDLKLVQIHDIYR